MITIDTESKKNSSLFTDIDKFRNRYITSNGYFVFPSPSIWTLEKNRYFLLRNCRKDTLKAKYIMRPDYMSYDEYGTTTLWQTILFVNQIFCREEFVVPEVLIPSLESIVYICRDKFPTRQDSELDEVSL